MVAKKKTLREGTSWQYITQRAYVPNGTFLTLHFAVTVREREERDCLVAKMIYFNITKLLRTGNIAKVCKTLSYRSNLPFNFVLQVSLSLCILLSEWWERKRERQVMPLLWIKDDDCQKNTRLKSPNLLLHENMAANCNHEDCGLLYSKMKSHYIYDTMNYTVTRYVTQHLQCSSIQSLAYFAMSLAPQPPLVPLIKCPAIDNFSSEFLF